MFRFTSHKTTVIAKREVENLRLVLAEMNLPDNNNFLLPVEDLRTLIVQTEQRKPQDPLLPTLYAQLGRIYAQRLERGESQNYREEEAIAIEYLEKAIELQKALGQE